MPRFFIHFTLSAISAHGKYMTAEDRKSLWICQKKLWAKYGESLQRHKMNVNYRSVTGLELSSMSKSHTVQYTSIHHFHIKQILLPALVLSVGIGDQF